MALPPAGTQRNPFGRLRLPVRLILFGGVAVTSVAFGFLGHTVNEARLLMQHYGYYAMAGTFAWFVVAAVVQWRRSPSRALGLGRRERVRVLAVIGALTLVAAITVPYTYKVLYDEYVLQATAWCLHETREVGAIVRGFYVEGMFSTLQSYLDKRPIFYTFAVSLLHDLTGYREANAFALNTALMPVLLAQVYWFARRYAGAGAAMAAMLAFGATSLVAYNATGAGMEMLNMVMLLAAMHLSLSYLQQPDERRLTVLVLAAVLLAQTRYESALFVLPVALVVLEGWRRAGRLILPAAAMLAPALLIPCALQNTYLSGTPLLWELREGESARFSVQYLGSNLGHAIRFLYSFTGGMTNSWWIGVAGVPAVLLLTAVGLRHLPSWRRVAPSRLVLAAFGLAITANLGLLMFYYWGQLDDPIVARLSLPFSALAAFAIAWVVQTLPEAVRTRGARLAMGGALLAYFSTGLVANADHWKLNLQAREIAWEIGWVRARSPAESCLVITNKSALIWLVDRIPAMQVTRARLRAEEVRYHLAQGTFRDVYVLQKFRPIGADGGYQLEPEDRLPDSFVLEPVVERRFGVSLARISRLTRIETKPTPPAPSGGQAS